MRQPNLVLILARDLADKLASAVFLVDEDGTLVYFNERAGEILGRTFAQSGRMKADEWTQAFAPMDDAGRLLAPEELPLVVALREHTPAHRSLRIRSLDGTERAIAVTALPFFARQGEFVGAAAVFWELHPGDRPQASLETG